MLIKQCQFSGKDEDGVYFHLLRPGYKNTHLTKTASTAKSVLDEIDFVMSKVPRDPNLLYALVSAMGAWEYWGQNTNGDAFPEKALIHTPPNWGDLSFDLRPQFGKTWEWGYPTFYNAHAYQHHVNKDPARAFGTVVYATWDPFMKRVLLVIAFDRKRADMMGAISVIDKIDNGEFPDVSMGCKVPYDLCTRCADWDRITGDPKTDLRNNKIEKIRGLSETTKDYCDHLTHELGRIYSDGVKAGMINLQPRFFDISVVFIGADKTSKVMAKLAGRCPIRENAAVCGNCKDCEISSTHVYEVWSGGREKVAAELPKVGFEMNPQTSRVMRRIVGDAIEEGIDQGAKILNRRMNQNGNKQKKSQLENEDILKEAFAPGDSYTSPAEERRLSNYFKTWKSKRAEIEKRVRSNFEPMLPSIGEAEEDLPEDVLEGIAKDVPSGLGTAGALGIALKPREFQRTILISMGKKSLADDLDSRGIEFEPGAPPERMTEMDDDFVPSLLEKLIPLISGRSAFGPAFHKRVIIMISGPRNSDVGTEATNFNEHPLLSKLSAAYSDYRRQLLYKVASHASKMVHENPKVLLEFFPQALDLSFTNGLAKTGGDVLESLIGMMPTMYLNGAYLDEPVSSYVAAHSSFDGIVAAGVLATNGRVA